MCITPKLLYIKSQNSGLKYTFLVPCGNCYECQNVKRSEFVLRCIYELKQCKSCFFVTLTYNDNNLHFYTEDLRRSALSELNYINSLPNNVPFKYSNFILHKEDFSRFMSKMQTVLKRRNHNLRFRMVVAGEYGTFSNRPHGHALIFSPVEFNKYDFEKLILECWPYGNVKVQLANQGGFNYIAKHYVKQDIGSKLQQRVAPRFLKYSVYDGGIGSNLINDNSLISNYFNEIYFVYLNKYKISIPRFIRRKLHPNSLTELELLKKSNESLNNFLTREFFKGFREDYSTQVFQDGSFSITYESIKDYIKKGHLTNFNHNYQVQRQRFHKKVLSLRRKGFIFEKNDCITF